MLKLSEWNRVLAHANKCVENLKSKGFDSRFATYTMYDGRKGIYIQLFDNNNELYKEYASGIFDAESEYKKALDLVVEMIIERE
jgi:hypothetical protein